MEEIVMTRTTLFAACALVLITSVAQAQIVIDSQPVVTTYYPPAPSVTYYAPTVSPTPVVTYDVPTVAAAPVTTYYAPTTSFYAPSTTTYYAGTAVVTPVTVTGRPITYGSSAYGTFRPYVPGQPVRNSFRFFVP
jgi:hypothetical protein